uniref:DUF148 domain-containing protein n=1 Tax=Steinernema glaseri TaxID=37863 RepID=A0A1I7YLM1_9BILA
MTRRVDKSRLAKRGCQTTMSILTLLFVGGAALIASAQNVPSVNANTNNAWNAVSNNAGWNGNTNSLSQLLSSPSVLVVSGTFRQMYNYVSQAQQNVVNGDMTRQQADQAVLNWVRQQSQNVQQSLRRIHDEVNALSSRLGGVYAEGSSGLSQETQNFFSQLNQIDRNTALSLKSIDQSVKTLLQNLSPQMVQEIMNFDAKGLQLYSQRFSCPSINGVAQFTYVNNPQCNNNANNANNGCTCGNSGNNGWGNSNGGWNSGNGGNGWNSNSGGGWNSNSGGGWNNGNSPNWNGNTGGWNNGASNGGLAWRK